MTERICSVDDCDNPHRARGFCGTHYSQNRKAGLLVLLVRDFWSKVDKAGPNGCWLWLGGLNDKGYGKFYTDGRVVRAHRRAYELLVGEIPSGLVLDHLCRVRHCVNPDHLEPVTNLENLARGEGPNATALRDNTCIRGHEFTEANTLPRHDRPGVRVCRICHNKQRRKGSGQIRLTA